MKSFIIGLTALVFMAASPAPAGEGITPVLKMDTTYNLVFGSTFIDMAQFPGRNPGTQWALVWEGTVKGDLDGIIRWWVPFDFASFSFLSTGRWELWDCAPEYPIMCDYDNTDLLLMAGYDQFGYVSASDWEGKGIVTDANEEYSGWVGRRITDGGNVELYPDGFPCCGEGFFTIYDRPSNKH